MKIDKPNTFYAVAVFINRDETDLCSTVFAYPEVPVPSEGWRRMTVIPLFRTDGDCKQVTWKPLGETIYYGDQNGREGENQTEAPPPSEEAPIG